MADADRRIYDYFREQADTPEVAGLAFAAYVFDKYEWIDLQTTNMGQSPSAIEIDAWIHGLPNSRLDNLLRQAIDLFDTAARTYLQDQIDAAVRRAEKRAISREVRRSNRVVIKRVERVTNFWRGLPGNLFVGFLSSIIFVLVVAGCAWIFNSDPSPFATLKRVLRLGEAPAMHEGQDNRR